MIDGRGCCKRVITTHAADDNGSFVADFFPNRNSVDKKKHQKFKT